MLFLLQTSVATSLLHHNSFLFLLCSVFFSTTFALFVSHHWACLLVCSSMSLWELRSYICTASNRPEYLQLCSSVVRKPSFKYEERITGNVLFTISNSSRLTAALSTGALSHIPVNPLESTPPCSLLAGDVPLNVSASFRSVVSLRGGPPTPWPGSAWKQTAAPVTVADRSRCCQAWVSTHGRLRS